MFNNSRIAIYDYVYDLFYNVVTRNVYLMNEPTELTESDKRDGFIVIRLGNFVDESEFLLNTYGWVRVFVEAFVPPITRGRVSESKFATFEDGINEVIEAAAEDTEAEFYVEQGSLLSSDDKEQDNQDNQFFVFVKSFIVVADKEKQSTND